MIIKVIRFILFISSVFFLLCFIVPVVFGASINIGNITGTVISIIVLIYSIKMYQIHTLLIRLWHNNAGKALLIILSVIIAAIFVLAVITTACMINSATKKPSQNATVIVLGCRVYGERPSMILTQRLDAAYYYLSKNENSVCIVSGGKGKGEDISEALCMYRYLSAKGISDDRIILEDKSTSTKENLAFSQEIIADNNLCKDVAIATSEFHEKRASMAAEEVGLNASSISAHTSWWLFPTCYIREMYGIIHEWIF